MPERLSEQELEFALEIVEKDTYCCNDLYRTVREASVDFDRTYKSLWMICVRLHVIVHQDLPLNMRDNPDWFCIPQTIKDFADNKGYCVVTSVKQAKRNSSNRTHKRTKKVALEMMSDYYKANKTWLPDRIKKQRQGIIESLMSGDTVEEVFLKYLSV